MSPGRQYEPSDICPSAHSYITSLTQLERHNVGDSYCNSPRCLSVCPSVCQMRKIFETTRDRATCTRTIKVVAINSSRCLLYYFYHNIPGGRWFTYVHIIRASHCLYACAARRGCEAFAGRRPSFRPGFTCLLPCDCRSRDRRRVQTGGAISGHFSSQTLLNEDRQCSVLWILERRRARSSCSVCCGWYDWRRPLSRSAVLFATLWHCRELSDERYTHHIQFEFWLLRRLTPVVTDRPPPVLRRQQFVPSVSSTTPCANLQTACC